MQNLTKAYRITVISLGNALRFRLGSKLENYNAVNSNPETLNMVDLHLQRIFKNSHGYWSRRLAAELKFAFELSRVEGGKYDSLLHNVLEAVQGPGATEGGVNRMLVEEIEASMAQLGEAAKKFTILCVAHAHIDMNWMWRWDETVAITLDTFRTMLDLMDQYPGFTFSQSQASVYRLVERYDEKMLAAIRQRVEEGRWEVAATTWVEADKNMPTGESMARHLLYTRRYLKELFNLPDEAFQMDYEPDTFGHSRNIPEILADAGVRYYYHCRGDQDELLYRWQAPSGRCIMVYREPTWYLGPIEPDMAVHVLDFCSRYGMDTMLKVYGVGDHGGGPTRRDVERLIDMDTWPIFPRIQFGTYGQFFSRVEPIAERLPVKEEELNFIFTGCYSSQSRIKRANRLSEAALFDAEALSSIATLQHGAHYASARFTEAWKNTLFNQFHDILPGSGTLDTREYALGLFQEIMAVAGSQKIQAMRRLVGLWPHPELPDREAMSEGAGVGFGLPDFRVSQVSRGQGIQRSFSIFNTAAWDRSGLAEITLWDWEGSLDHLSWRDADGKPLRWQLLDGTWQNYWGHRYVRILVPVHVPACGTTTLLLDEMQTAAPAKEQHLDWRTERPADLELENEYLLARFDPVTCALSLLRDKASGEMLVSPVRPAGLRYILEDDRLGMTAWTVGRYRQVRSLQDDVRLVSLQRGELRQSITYQAALGESQLAVTVALEAGKHQLDYRVECDWLEVGRKNQGVPQLNFYLPLAYPCRAYRYDIPLGLVERPALDWDVPAVSWGSAVPENPAQEATLMLVSQGSYGFRGVEDSLSLTLLRSSYDPDLFPELGHHILRFGVHWVGARSAGSALARAAFADLHPLEVLSGSTLGPWQGSFMKLEGQALLVSGMKLPEDDLSGKSLCVRLFEVDGIESEAALHFSRPIRRAVQVDVHEQPIPGAPVVRVEGDKVVFQARPYRLINLWIEFE
jgi:alpha-mannosidase